LCAFPPPVAYQINLVLEQSSLGGPWNVKTLQSGLWQLCSSQQPK